MSGPKDLIVALRMNGPLTNARLAEITCDHGGSVARTMAQLIKAGRAKRVDAGRGRGSIAIYQLIDRDTERRSHRETR